MYLNSIKQEILRQFPYSPTDDQEQSIHELAQFITDTSPGSFFLLKGYAGTGKTTIVSCLADVLEKRYETPVLLAPTGRAAKVLASYSNRKAFTIHKKIYRLATKPDGSVVTSLLTNKHKNTFFIVDEASMIATGSQSTGNLFDNTNLLDDLIGFVYSGKNCRLILIGDAAQLPPVRQIESPALNISYLKSKYQLTARSFELKEVVRQASTSGILFNATMLRKLLTNHNAGFPKFRQKDFKDFIRLDHDEVVDEINNAFHPDSLQDSLIICRSNKRANMFNQSIRQRVLYMEEELNGGDLLMVVRNNYYWLPQDSEAGFIANGDTIEIRSIRRVESVYGFRFADLIVSLIDYPDEPEMEVKVLLDTLHANGASLDEFQLKKLFEEVAADHIHISNKSKRLTQIKESPYLQALQIKFAYALTCHKSQGGQWKYVFIDMGYLPSNKPDTEYLRWLYTAITRATEKVFLLNFKDDFFEQE